MSIWIYERSKDRPGRINVTTASVPELSEMLGVGLAIALAGPLVSLLLVALGFLLFSAAKGSMIWRGVLVSWGSKGMTSGFRTCYRAGYVLMTLGVVLALVAAHIFSR
jgi:hypothetical protein